MIQGLQRVELSVRTFHRRSMSNVPQSNLCTKREFEEKTMPSTYAHYRFGKDVLGRLPAKQKQDIQAHPDLYNIGLHGPDLLFYYKPISHNPVNQLGF